jgi:hypothetical protein
MLKAITIIAATFIYIVAVGILFLVGVCGLATFIYIRVNKKGPTSVEPRGPKPP